MDKSFINKKQVSPIRITMCSDIKILNQQWSDFMLMIFCTLGKWFEAAFQYTHIGDRWRGGGFKPELDSSLLPKL